MSASGPRIATAPVSFGIFGDVGGGLSPQQIVDAIVAAGFTATELGPPAMLGTPAETARLLTDAGLDAVGAYVPFHFASDDDARFDAEFASFRVTVDELAARATPGSLAILADEGDDELRHRPRRDVDEVHWDDTEWLRAGGRIARCAEVASAAGLRVSFHPHLATAVQTPAEIGRLLVESDVSLTVDSGHFLLGGWDPADALGALGTRVNHLHVKDVHLGAVPPDEVAATMDIDEWWPNLAAPLGEGDVDLGAFVAACRSVDATWVVIEQDRHAVTIDELDSVVAGERANREWLHRRLTDGDPAGAPPATPD